MRTLFAPGCALKEYKPKLVLRMTEFLVEAGIISGTYDQCCKLRQKIDEKTILIDCCPGCSHMFNSLAQVRTISLWNVLLDTDFPFPSYHGQKMTIHDACHARGRYSSEMQASSRALCRKMDIELIELDHSRDGTVCCGGCAKDHDTRRHMAIRRAEALPIKDVVLYCTGCTRSFSITTACPHHLLDLVFAQPTEGLTLQG